MPSELVHSLLVFLSASFVFFVLGLLTYKAYKVLEGGDE